MLSLDDGYVPATALANAQRLVEEAGAFLLLGSVGSATGSAIASYTRSKKVPLFGQLSGAALFRRQASPYVINVRASSADDAAAMVDKATQFGLSRMAFIAQNDTLGESGLHGANLALAARGLQIYSQGW